MANAARALGAEFVGTFGLVAAGAGAIMVSERTGSGGPAEVALAFGLAVAVAVRFLAPYSGAHINPAVTLGLAATGRFPRGKALPYVVAQSAGATTAALLLRLVLGNVASVGATLPSVNAGSAVAIEAALTALLMLVVAAGLEVRRLSRVGPLALGLVVGLEAYFGGGLTGASMNPGRSLGPALASGELGDLWIYLLGPVVGALAAQVLVGAFCRAHLLAGWLYVSARAERAGSRAYSSDAR